MTIAVGLLVLSIGIAFLFIGPAAVSSWRFWLEAATCLYYLASAFLVLMVVRRALLAFPRSLHERWRFAPGVRILICEVAPLSLFVLFALPYALAFSHVHRFKMPNLTDPRQARQREFEEVEFHSADGTTLRGWWIPARTPSSRTLVFCHGIAANRTIFLPFVDVGDWLDANILMFDLRGHGDSGGRTISLGYREKEDVLAAIAYARCAKSAQARQVVGMGVSMGAATLAQAAAVVEPPLDAVILDSCFTSTSDMTHAVFNRFPPACEPWLRTMGLPLADWHAGCPMSAVSPEASIGNLRAPVLFLHSHGDPLIPSEHAYRLYFGAAEPKSLCVFELEGHCDGFFAERERYRAEVVSACSWLQR
jgi:alpha-beta hydrolase superfamily lysophospholipase